MARDRLMVGGRCMAGVSQKGGRCEGSRVGLRMRLRMGPRRGVRVRVRVSWRVRWRVWVGLRVGVRAGVRVRGRVRVRMRTRVRIRMGTRVKSGVGRSGQGQRAEGTGFEWRRGGRGGAPGVDICTCHRKG